MKFALFFLLLVGMTSCTWLASHPEVEAALEKEVVDIAKDTEAVVEDIITPTSEPAVQTLTGTQTTN